MCHTTSQSEPPFSITTILCVWSFCKGNESVFIEYLLCAWHETRHQKHNTEEDDTRGPGFWEHYPGGEETDREGGNRGQRRIKRNAGASASMQWELNVYLCSNAKLETPAGSQLLGSSPKCHLIVPIRAGQLL